MSDTVYKLSDDTISMIAKKLQLAILTGTDIVDHLRLMELTKDNSGTLFPTDNYIDQFETGVQVMLERLQDIQNENTEDTNETADGFTKGADTEDTPFEL